jgi:hypothetical protein
MPSIEIMTTGWRGSAARPVPKHVAAQVSKTAALKKAPHRIFFAPADKPFVISPDAWAGPGVKVFCFFFSKKKAFLSAMRSLRRAALQGAQIERAVAI